MGVYEYLQKLRSKSTGEFTSKNGPSFRSMHDVIHHVAWIDFLDIWRVEVLAKYKFATLDEWAKSEPTWEDIVILSDEIFEKHLPQDDFGDKQEESAAKRDMVFKNMCLCNQHGLLYLEFCRSMNHGDVRCILQLLVYLILIFAATGKHKYATHMTKFLSDLFHVYPPYLRDAILRNWLFNIKGTKDGFCAFDWLQELTNLYVKVRLATTG